MQQAAKGGSVSFLYQCACTSIFNKGSSVIGFITLQRLSKTPLHAFFFVTDDSHDSSLKLGAPKTAGVVCVLAWLGRRGEFFDIQLQELSHAETHWVANL